MGQVRNAVRETGSSLATVFRNRNLARINAAFGASLIGDWAYATAVVVWAYDVGGTALVAVFSAIRLALMALATPFASTLADRLPRKLVMIGSDLTRLGLVVPAAICVAVDTPVWIVFVLAILASIAMTPFRPAQAALLPSLVRSPAELTAANGVASTLESVGFFLGPVVGAFLLTVADVPTVFLFNAATFVVSAVLVLGVRVPAKAQAEEPEDAAVEEEKTGFLTEAAAGFRTIRADRNLRLITVLYSAQTIVAGATVVFGVAMAVEILETGPKGIGYIDAAFGVGAILGGLLSVGLATRQRLAVDFGWGVLFWGIPLLAVALWPNAAAVFAAMLVMGAANPVVDVNATTLLQRLTPDAVLGRVFGALDAVLIATMALGALVMPLLIAWFGLRGAITLLAALMVVFVVPALPTLRRLDTQTREPAGLVLLRQVPLFAPLDPKKLERLAQLMIRLEVPAGAVVLHEGDTGDRFYVVESGLVGASHNGTALSTAGPAEPFGEIALLEDIPRTATVTAVEPTVLWALDRDDFLGAVTGSDDVRSRAVDLASRRIRAS